MARKRGYWVLKVAGGAYQRPGLPDLVAIKGGVATWLEVKRPGCKVTPRQLAVIEELMGAGCFTCVTTSVADAEDFLSDVEIARGL